MEKDPHLEALRNRDQTGTIKPLVSVAIIAYNVGNYIEAAIESVLNQHVSFDVEIVIGEDCSKDNTREILISYEQKYPQIIKLLQHEKNLGLTLNSKVTQDSCQAKYIALLDGDDYWTDNEKLKIQVQFLEENEDYSGCSHQSMKIFEDGSESILFGTKEDQRLNLTDMLTHRKFHTSSLMYRRKYWISSGGFPTTISSNERALYPMLTIYGPIYYFSKEMCVYRLSSTNLSSRIDYKELEKDLYMVPWLKSLDASFPEKRFRSFLHLCMYTYGKKIALAPLIKHYILFSFYSFSYFPNNLKDVKWGTIFFLRRAFQRK